RNAKQGRQVEKNRLGNEDGANGLIVQRLLRNVNPGYPDAGRTHNCVNCSIATDATLAGNPASLRPV
ncbi:hypothetical protein, partial [Pseudomonas syringae]|uniref:hypothetical protein n=1 Tax=Pseudomonas syringae TaxID=317 RepID=UPI00117B83A1